MATKKKKVGITVSIPKDKITELGMKNLKAMIDAKGDLFCKALRIESLAIEETDDAYSFPWFCDYIAENEVKAYTNFVSKLVENANKSKWVNAKPKKVDNEKYAFRCFLLRLGFIGDEYKEDRRILLRNLDGSSAFRAGVKKEEGNV